MGKGATEGAASADGDLPGVSELLRAGSFQERLEKARLQRATVFALGASNADLGLGLKAPRKPWESAAAPGDKGALNPGPDPVEHRASDVAATISIAVAKIGAKPDTTARAPSIAPSAPVTDTLPQQTSLKRKFRIARISGGFILGLVIGGGLMWLAPWIKAATLATGIFDGQQTAVAAVSPGDAGIAQPRAGPAVVVTPATAAGANVDPDPVVHGIADEFVQPVQPSVLSASAIRPDRPVALPEAPFSIVRTATVAPVPAVFYAPETSEWNGPAVNNAVADIIFTAPAALAVLAENADTPLDRQPLPVAFTPADAIPLAAEGPGADSQQILGNLSVHVLATEGASQDSLDEVARSLRAAGYKLVEAAHVPFTVTERQVRFYHTEDAEAARALASTLGASARDFTTFDPQPPPGIVEVWLSGGISVTAAAKNETPPPKKKKKPKAAAKVAAAQPIMTEEQQLQALRDRLLAQLQNNGNP